MNHQEALEKLASLMKDGKICMLSTLADGKIVSRPMAIQATEFDGDVWFFTYESSNKVQEVQIVPTVNVSFESHNSWVSVSGDAEVVHDHAKAEELWNPLLKAWFPGGVDEPGLTLIKIHATSAEYWDSSSSKLVSLFGTAKAAVTGKQAQGGENETLEL